MRPREFDHDDVLRIAFDQFWRKGVRGTSLSDIARDAGVRAAASTMPLAARRRCSSRAYERLCGRLSPRPAKGARRGLIAKTLCRVLRPDHRQTSTDAGNGATWIDELGAAEGEGLDEDARQAFAGLISRITMLVQETLAAGAERGEFNGNPAAAALHIITVTRGLGVLERAFGDEPQLRKIAAHTIDLVLGKKGG